MNRTDETYDAEKNQTSWSDILHQVLQSGYQPHGTGTIIVSSLKDMTSEEMAVWLSRLRRSLLTPRIDHHVILVLSKSIKTCRPFLWFGASGPLLHCVWSVDDASLELDAQSIALFTLSHAMPTALLSTATIPFPGLGDQLFDLLMRTDGSFAMFATDMQVAVGAGERNQRLAIHPPFMDVGFRLFRPVSATVVLLRMATLVAYSNPFLLAEDVLNRFNATMETDFLLNASYGFVSSEGWFAEDLQQRLYGPGGSNSTDPHLSGGIVLFSMRPFSMMPKWFRGTACQHVCKSNLQCAEEALGSACALLGDDEALLKTLRNTFMLQHPAARSARPRLLQAGPSSCGTTAIAHYFSDGHNLRVAKNYVEGREIRDHVRKDLQLGLAPYRSLDRFDVVADAFDIVRVGVHFCSDHLGHGGQNCEQVHGDFLDMNLREYRYILESLRDAYPNLRFIHNSCNLQSWLSKRVHNCWPHLVSVGPSADWEGFLRIWRTCCDPVFGPSGNSSCFTRAKLSKLDMPRRLIREDFAYPVCCDGLPFYEEAWHEVHRLLPKVIDARRLVPFHIVKDDPMQLSAALGLQDDFKRTAWRQIHKTQRKTVEKEVER